VVAGVGKDRLPSMTVSKSKYLNGLQCHKLLWYAYNDKKAIPAPDEATQAIFDQGHDVGALARSLFPGGIEISGDVTQFAEVLERSRGALSLRKPLFEAAFTYKNAYARADILLPVHRNEWDIVEVKSSTQVKEINLHDLALQRYAYEGAGLRIRTCSLMHIDNTYVRRGAIDPQRLLATEDVTDDVALLLPGVERNLASMVRIIGAPKYPRTPIGPHCSDPYDCPLRDLCWDSLPEENVFSLYRGGAKAWELFGRGIEKLDDIPEDFPLSAVQKIQMEAYDTGKPVVDRKALGAFLGTLEYPLYYLDFETFATAIPLYDGVRPYQNIPFQFSLHIVGAPGKTPEHHAFLAPGEEDPRTELLAELKDLLGKKGSIICYNASFEKARLRESCEAYPSYAAWWEKTEGRVVDLLVPFRSFQYYHPSQRGSASMKVVLPAITGKGYEGMAIADGGTASREYLRVTYGGASAEEKTRVRDELLEYCGLDTMGNKGRPQEGRPDVLQRPRAYGATFSLCFSRLIRRLAWFCSLASF
jgi:hypothetical protein